MAEIIGLLIAIATLLVMLPGLLHWTVLGAQEVHDNAMAEQAAIFNAGAEKYITDNEGSLLSTATATTPVVVTAAQLENSGDLTAGFSATNLYGQTWQLEVLQPTPGTLQSLTLTTGGTPIKDEEAANIAQHIGAAGGFIALDDSGAYPEPGTPLRAYGTQGQWGPLVLNGFTDVSKGELVTYLSLVSSAGTSTSNDYLYRYSVPGNPDLNTMHTPLVMAAVESKGSACSALGAIAQDGTGALLSCQADIWSTVGNGSWKPPVSTYSALPATGNTVGDVRLTTDTDRAFAWTGNSWAALAVDQNGNLVVPAALTVGGPIASTGNITSASNINAAGNIASGNGNFTAYSNGDAVSNSNSWAMQAMKDGGQESATGSAYLNDVYDAASGVWLSQVNNEVNTLNSNVSGLQSDYNSLQNQVTSNYNNQQGQLNTINSNLNNANPCTGGSPYAYNALNSICQKAQTDGLNVAFLTNIPAQYSTSTTYTVTDYWHHPYGYRSGSPSQCSPGYTPYGSCGTSTQTSLSPASFSYSVPSGSAPEILSITAIMGYQNGGGGYNSGAKTYGANWGNLSQFKGCPSVNGVGAGSVIATVNGTQVADIALSQEPNSDFYQTVISENAATFVVPPGGSVSIQANEVCVGFQGSIWTL